MVRTMERGAERGGMGVPPLVEYLDTMCRKAREYRLDKRSSLIVVAQLSPNLPLPTRPPTCGAGSKT